MRNNTRIEYSKIYFIFLFTFLCISGHVHGQSRTFITNGIFDARKVKASERVPLNGNWDFYPGKLLNPDELKFHKRKSLLVPSLWNEHPSMQNVGCGTYVLKVILPSSTGRWALELPQLYNSYSLYINSILLATNGKPSLIKETTELQWKPQYLSFDSETDTALVVLQLSNYHHHKGGIREQIYLGGEAVIKSHFETAFYVIMAEVILLIVIALFFLVLFFKAKKGRITLYFALLSICWATRELFSDLYPVSTVYPDINWHFLVKTEYVMLFMIMIFGTLFINKLFAELASEIFKYLIIFINCIYAAFTIFTPVMIFSRWLPLYLATAFAILIYSAIIIIRGIILEKKGAWFLTFGLILSVLTIGYDLIAYKGVIANHVLIGTICYILIYMFSAIGLLQYLKIIRSAESPSNTLRYQDLYQ
jgi:hypothetical protein